MKSSKNALKRPRKNYALFSRKFIHWPFFTVSHPRSQAQFQTQFQFFPTKICRHGHVDEMSGKEKAHTFSTHKLFEKAVNPNQPVNQNKMFISGFRVEHKRFCSVNRPVVPGSTDPDQSKKFMFMCLFLFLKWAVLVEVSVLKNAYDDSRSGSTFGSWKRI